jgi:ERCC4-related helicase
VFCNDMQSARSTHHFLTEQGFNASCMHSGASTHLRHAHTAFASQSFPIAQRRGIITPGCPLTTLLCTIGILPKRRAEYFEQFASGECPILVCTDIASRGLDTTAVLRPICAARTHARTHAAFPPNRSIV